MANHAGALVTSVFTFEMLMKRALRRETVARDFSVGQANRLLDKNGFETVLDKWSVFDRQHRRLTSILGRDWQHVPAAKKMRNNFVHGNHVYPLAECKQEAEQAVVALQKFTRGWSKTKVQTRPPEASCRHRYHRCLSGSNPGEGGIRVG